MYWKEHFFSIVVSVPNGRETFERLEHDSCDESESNCGLCWAPRYADSDCLPLPRDDCWNVSRELPPLLSNHLGSHFQIGVRRRDPGIFKHSLNKPTEQQEGTPVVVESPNTPAPLVPCVRESIHPIQSILCGL